ncbi:hypothetical protein [uncultured Prevotella sp.]|uniref:hypothetical protein n=1 Tax=uncultured Prevotella sp. TaxID=159272 RepID=UPI002803B580|nr:hypothetical protein [uncultured Prevotella sp.]
MKKNYITPEINVIQLETLCDGGIVTASVYKGSIDKGECISNFEVVNEKDTRGTEYKDLWGESNSGNWGDD